MSDAAMNGSHVLCRGFVGRISVVTVAIWAAATLPSMAAQNCISNGDFETDVNGNVSASINWGYAKSGNQYSPANWTLNDRNHMGLVNEGTDRHNVLDTLGAHSLAIERYKGTSNTLEAKQSFSIPAPGTYRLTLLYMSWNADTSYSHLRTFTRLIQPGGVVTNQLNSFTPFSYGNGLESLGSFMSDTPTLILMPASKERLRKKCAVISNLNSYTI